MSSTHETSQASSSPVDMTRESPVTSPTLGRRNDLQNIPNGHESALQHRILELKKQQQLQQQILLQQFQVQQQQLAQQHEEQLRHHLKELWEQEKEQQAREQERLESLKKKEKHEQSAVASSEVKQKLQGFILNKKQREAAAAANGTVQGHGFRSWSVLHNTSSDGQSKQVVSVTGGVAPPYHLNPLLKNFDDDFPLRKTASEPNLLKVRLKQRVIERRSSPIARRRDRHHPKRKSHLAIEPNSNPDSGPNSPPVTVSAQMSPPAGHNMPIQEGGKSPYNPATAGSMTDLSLYSSPSMPNISLGRPPATSSQSGDVSTSRLAPVSEAEVRAAFTARFGTPLTGQMLSGTLPYYPTLPVIDATDYSRAASPVACVNKQMQSLERQSSAVCNLPTIYHGTPITDTQVAHARLNKQGGHGLATASGNAVSTSGSATSSKPGHRPLGRTQSAPLPLGHPMLMGGSYDDYQQKLSNHNLLKQQIRQTVLTRVGSRAQSMSAAAVVSETPEPFDDTDGCQVIDLTDRGDRERERVRSERERESGEESEICRQQKERETFLQQQRDLMMRHTLQVSEGSAFSPRSHQVGRPLSRALSSPLVTLAASEAANASSSTSSSASSSSSPTTGLAFDSLMLKHACVCGDNASHLEHGGRLQSVWARLLETGLTQRCDRVRSRKASLEELQVCHSEPHVLLFGTNPLNRQKLDMCKLVQLPIKSFVRLPCGGVGVDSDTTWNELHTAPAARMAVGCVIELAIKTAMGDIRNGMAVVRPPGHHAETSQAMGFCFFNSVAIAARLLQQRLDLRRILIVDWDVHHGNGTQQMFYEDHRVLYLSIHRHDDGNFFPGTGGPTECGAGSGLGFNVNIAWSGGLNPPMGDAEYLAAFRTVVMPIAREFAPDIVLVSAGFDAAVGHPPPLGGYKLTPACFGYMTKQLTQLADKKVVLSLEGGYDLPAICDSAEECVRALLGDEPRPLAQDQLRRPPNHNAVETLQKTIAIQLNRWPVLKRTAHLVSCCALEAEQFAECEESETVSAMASLSMQQQQQQAAAAAANRLHSSQTPEQTHESTVEPMEEDDYK